MVMNDKLKELIAVGASVSANCQPCLQTHLDKAFEIGVDPMDVAEAVEVGKRVRKGAAARMDAFASSCKYAVPEAKNPCCGG